MLCAARARALSRLFSRPRLRASLVTLAHAPPPRPPPAGRPPARAVGWVARSARQAVPGTVAVVGCAVGCVGSLALVLASQDSVVSVAESPASATLLPDRDQQGQGQDQDSVACLELLQGPQSRVVYVARVVQVCLVFFPACLTFPFSLLHSSIQKLWLRLLVRTLEAAGPLFVKLGQWASTRPDVFSPVVCDQLAVLHDSVFAMPAATALRVLADEVGEVDSVFSSLDATPIGCGCIAQAHVGVLRKTGERVVVKIRRPHVKQMICRDLRILARLAALADAVPLLHAMRLPEVVDNFSVFMCNQLSFLREANNLQLFVSNFEGPDACKGIAFPRPVFEHTTESVLVETYQPGFTLSALLRGQVAMPEAARQIVGKRVLDAFLQMVFVDNFVHADLHPGNVLIHPTGNDATISLVDAGLVVSLTRDDRENFIDLVATVAKGDGARAAELIIRRGDNEGRVVDPDGFIRGMEAIVGGVATTTFRLSKVQIGDVLSRVLHLVRRHKVHLDPVFANLVVSIVVLEGVGRQIRPDQDLFSLVVPLLPRAHREYVDGALQIAFR